jgi:hypothetical protein
MKPSALLLIAALICAGCSKKTVIGISAVNGPATLRYDLGAHRHPTA